MNKKLSDVKRSSYSSIINKSKPSNNDIESWPNLNKNVIFKTIQDENQINILNIVQKNNDCHDDPCISAEVKGKFKELGTDTSIPDLSSDPEENGEWITVKSQKKKNTIKNSPRKIPISSKSIDKTGVKPKSKEWILKEKITVASNEKSPIKIVDEQIKLARELRKQRIKDEKKRKREEKIRILRESLCRDTKISVISQNACDLLQKSSRQNTLEEMVFENTLEEYPSLSSVSQKSPKKMNRSNNKQLSREPVKNAASNIAANDANQYYIDHSNKENSILSYSSAASQKEKQLITSKNVVTPKKKVKTTDIMQIDFGALIEAKKKHSKSKIISPILKKKPVKLVIEKHYGKKREGKPKRMSTLRKNIINEKKRQAELLLSLLKERQRELDSGNEEKVISQMSEDPQLLIVKREDSLLEVTFETERSPHTVENTSIAFTEGTAEIVKEINVLMDPVHNRKFREYCHHVLTPEINEVLKELIELLVKFQDRQYKADPMKAKMRRRFYCGLKEAFKHMNRLSCLIVAPNLKPSPGDGCVDQLVSKVLSRAEETGVPVMFGLSHRQLGRLCFKKVPVSCFAIVNYQGAQEKFHRLMELVPEAKKQYEALVLSRPPEEEPESSFNLPEPVESPPQEYCVQNILHTLKC